MEELPDLSDDEWLELMERLTHHAACVVARHTWRGLRLAQGGSVPGGVDPADLAAEAITDVIEGRRNWNQEAEPNFLAFLRSVVDSKVSHLVNGAENRATRRMEATEGADFDAAGGAPDPAVVCVEQDDLDRLRDRIRKEVAGDPLAEGLLSCLAEDMTKPSEIAELLEESVENVNNAQKRLRRKADKIVQNKERR